MDFSACTFIPSSLAIQTSDHRSSGKCRPGLSKRSAISQRSRLCLAKKNIQLSASTTEPHDLIAEHIESKYFAKQPQQSIRVLFGLAGMPGSGKSYTMSRVYDRLRKKHPNQVSYLPMDGFHYYRSELDQFPDPEQAHLRRGAPHTFDANKFKQVLRNAKFQVEEDVFAPGFDHSVKDPEPNVHCIAKESRLVLVEGNYLLYNEQDWQGVKELFDEVWYLDTVTVEQAMDRVMVRQIQEIGRNELEAKRQIDFNDRLNAILIDQHKNLADRILHSRL